MRSPEPGRRLWARSRRQRLGLAVAAALIPAAARAQSLEPRAFSPGPVGMNFVVAGASQSSGGISVGADVPVTDAHVTVTGPAFGYARTLDLWGDSGKIDVILPTGRLSGSAIYQGQPTSREVNGLGDPLVRLSVLLRGASAMTPAQFAGYRPDLIVGASVQVSLPLGQYDDTRVLNLGAHRWSVKPEIGVSKTFRRWTVELAASATFYSANDDFFGGSRRSQDPIVSARTNLIYSFRSGVWASLDATYYAGGRTHLNGADDRDLQENSRLGVTFAIPVTRRGSLKLNLSRGVSARTGNNYDLIGAAWQYRWGAGL